MWDREQQSYLPFKFTEQMSRNRAWVVVLEKCLFRKIAKVQNRYVDTRKGKPQLNQFFSLHPLVYDLNSVEIVKGLWDV